MVYCRCPNCGSRFHVNIGIPVDDWYRKFAPGLKSNEEPELACFACWNKLAIGDRVKIRIKPARIDSGFHVGDEGEVSAIETEAEYWCVRRANSSHPSFEV
jgi:hypothetical protein